jgi:uncharacterized protein (UPF0333 family)
MKEEKAQVNLEFLLLVVGGVVIVTAVALYIKSVANSAADAAITKSQQNTNP